MVKRGQPPEGYTTASRAKKMLGNISDGMLRSYVQRGEIEHSTPPGRKQGFYNMIDVRRLANKFDDFFDESSKPEVYFQLATREDLPELVDFLVQVFGGSNTLEKRTQWFDKNPETAFIERSRGKIVGCVYALPLTRQKIDEILADPNPGSTRSISANDIQPYTPDIPVYLYVVSMGVKPNTSDAAKRARGQTLIRGLLRFFVDLGNRGIHIKHIVARTNSHDGINILKRIGFTEIESHTQSRNFIIDVDISGIPLIMPYKRAFRKWASKV